MRKIISPMNIVTRVEPNKLASAVSRRGDRLHSRFLEIEDEQAVVVDGVGTDKAGGIRCVHNGPGSYGRSK